MNRIRLLCTTDRMYFELCQSILHMNDIPFQTENTMDSMYNAFGTFDIYVADKDEEKAMNAIDNHERSSNT